MSAFLDITGAEVDLTLTYSQYPPIPKGAKAIQKDASGDIREYTLVQVYASSANACSNGRVMYSLTTDENIVTDDISAVNPNQLKGFGIGAIAKGYFGWIQTWGPHSAIKKNTDSGNAVAVGDLLCGDPTADGSVHHITVGVSAPYIIGAVATGTATTGAATVAGFIRTGR